MVQESHQEIFQEGSRPKSEPDALLQAQMGAETDPRYTPLITDPADTAILRVTRETLQSSAGTKKRGMSGFAVQDPIAQSLIREMDASRLSVYAQIQTLYSSHDEDGRLLDTTASHIAYARRIDWESTHDKNKEQWRYVSPDQCIAYGMVAFNLSEKQLLAMLHVRPHDTMQPDLMTLDFAKEKFGLDHICAFFRHSDFENEPGRPSIYPFKAGRAIEMYGKEYFVSRDMGSNLEIFAPNMTDYFTVPKSIVERYNKHTMGEKVPALRAYEVTS